MQEAADCVFVQHVFVIDFAASLFAFLAPDSIFHLYDGLGQSATLYLCKHQ